MVELKALVKLSAHVQIPFLRGEFRPATCHKPLVVIWHSINDFMLQVVRLLAYVGVRKFITALRGSASTQAHMKLGFFLQKNQEIQEDSEAEERCTLYNTMRVSVN